MTIELIEPRKRPSLRRRIVTHALAIALLAGIIAAWVFSPLRHWLDISQLITALHGLSANAWMPLVMSAAFILGGLLMFPVSLLTAACMVIFGPWLGVLYALLGAVLSAAALYEIGRHGGASLRDRLTRGRLGRLRAALARHGMLAIIILRIVPVAPYSIVNLAAGAMRLHRRDYLIGTAIGMAPSAVLYALLVDRALAAIRQPHWTNFVWLGIAAVVFVGASVWLGRRMLIASRMPEPPP
ncbi:MAG: TVP38/TMEM64 family protein [Xanthomonadales bacterium]|nr:TVP38/TMEM64 family protein [Xanthomonadales bacterium]